MYRHSREAAPSKRNKQTVKFARRNIHSIFRTLRQLFLSNGDTCLAKKSKTGADRDDAIVIGRA
jgi:hypothetical protein